MADVVNLRDQSESGGEQDGERAGEEGAVTLIPMRGSTEPQTCQERFGALC